MITDDQRHTIVSVQSAAQFCQALIRLQQIVRGHASKRQDYIRPNQGYLLIQPWTAGIGFLWPGIAVVRWAAFEDIGNIDLLPLQTNRGKHRVQQLSGAPDEGFPLQILIPARSFPDHQQACIFAAYSKNSLGT